MNFHRWWTFGLPRVGRRIKHVHRLNAPSPKQVELAIKFGKAVFVTRMGRTGAVKRLPMGQG